MATRIIAVLNQKGGVGKTTTCVNLGAALARRGFRVLLVDMDPQANLTVHLGLEPQRLPHTTYSLLIGQHGLAEAVHATGVHGLFAVPSTLALANAEIQLASTVGRELVLREALEEWFESGAPETGSPGTGHPGSGHPGSGHPKSGLAADAPPPDAETADSGTADSGTGGSGVGIRPGADFVLIDCPPSLGTLTMNALCAAGEVLLPIQTEFFALQGVAGILESVRAVQRLNKGLRLSLVVPSLVDRRTTLARDVIDEVRTYFGDLVTRTEIRKNVKLAEAPSHGKTIFEWDPRCHGAQDYDSLAAEVLGETLPDPAEPKSVKAVVPADDPSAADDQREAQADSGEAAGSEERAGCEELNGSDTAAEEAVAEEEAADDDVPVLEHPISDASPEAGPEPDAVPELDPGPSPLDGSIAAAQSAADDAATPTRSSGIALSATVDPSHVPHLNAPSPGGEPRDKTPAAPEQLPPPASRFGTEPAAADVAPPTTTSSMATSSDTATSPGMAAGARRLPAVAETSSDAPDTPASPAAVDQAAGNEMAGNEVAGNEMAGNETAAKEAARARTSWWRSLRRNTLGD